MNKAIQFIYSNFSRIVSYGFFSYLALYTIFGMSAIWNYKRYNYLLLFLFAIYGGLKLARKNTSNIDEEVSANTSSFALCVDKLSNKLFQPLITITVCFFLLNSNLYYSKWFKQATVLYFAFVLFYIAIGLLNSLFKTVNSNNKPQLLIKHIKTKPVYGVIATVLLTVIVHKLNLHKAVDFIFYAYLGCILVFMLIFAAKLIINTKK